MINFDSLRFGGIFNLYNKLKLKLISQWQHISLSALKIKLIKLLSGLPDHSSTPEKTIEKLVKYEKFSIFFGASRVGFNQNVSHRPTRTDYFGLTMRIIGQINLARLICLTVIDNEDYQLYLGDIAYKTKHRTVVNFLLTVVFLFGVINSEWLVLYDKGGAFSGLSIYSAIIKNGFDPVLLQMTSNQAIKFQRSIHILITQLNRSFKFCCLFLAARYFSILLFNPNFYQDKEFVFYSLVWSLIAISVTFTLIGKYFAIFGYLILIQVYHLVRLESVVELADSYRSSKFSNELVSSFTKYTFDSLNQSEKCFKRTGFLVLCIFTVIAFIGDLCIFYGFIIRFHSPLFANSVGSMGCVVFIIIGCLSFIAREFIIKMERLYSHLHVICPYNVFNVYNQLKLLQLMERLSEPNNGIQLGSIATIGKDFFIRFMLEIGSSLMLFTLNFKRYF
uniref:Gustatory receptor n=1 Tax=Tetranychus urticae TaxID=32264 RepID=T1KQ64_TETUR